MFFEYELFIIFSNPKAMITFQWLNLGKIRELTLY